MEQVTYEGVEVDRCLGCRGLWLDAGESDALQHRKAAASIDTGKAADASQSHRNENYTCPRCSGGMVRMVDVAQTHIWYEKCSACGGVFFDAGEFRDLSERTVADFFKSLFTPERR